MSTRIRTTNRFSMPGLVESRPGFVRLLVHVIGLGTIKLVIAGSRKIRANGDPEYRGWVILARVLQPSRFGREVKARYIYRLDHVEALPHDRWDLHMIRLFEFVDPWSIEAPTENNLFMYECPKDWIAKASEVHRVDSTNAEHVRRRWEKKRRYTRRTGTCP